MVEAENALEESTFSGRVTLTNVYFTYTDPPQDGGEEKKSEGEVRVEIEDDEEDVRGDDDRASLLKVDEGSDRKGKRKTERGKLARLKVRARDHWEMERARYMCTLH